MLTEKENTRHLQLILADSPSETTQMYDDCIFLDTYPFPRGFSFIFVRNPPLLLPLKCGFDVGHC